MKHKKWPIYIWFLDEDLQKSAEYLTDKALLRSIDGCIGAIVSTIFYFIGIRSKKFYDYFFSKENADETMNKFFMNWPLKKKPSFAAYSRKESKWCKACHENFDYCVKYLGIMLDEYAFRNGNAHENAAFAGWLEYDAPSFSFQYANISKVTLPWKAIDPKFRRVDVVQGYRLQFMNSFEDDDPFGAYATCKRDIPEFVIKHFNSRQAFES